MKRIVSIYDLVDLVPDGAQYLYTNILTLPVDETADQVAQKIINGREMDSNVSIGVHYFLVKEEQFIEMFKSGYNDQYQQKLDRLLKIAQPYEKKQTDN